MDEAYAVVDLHCDTLTDWERTRCRDTLDDPARDWALSKLPEGARWAQCCAIFLPDTLRGAEAAAYFETYLESFRRQLRRFAPRAAHCRTAREVEAAWSEGKAALLLTVENGSVLCGELSRVALLRRAGVAALTLTWNGKNELGSGKESDEPLTPFGRAALRELEEQGILADVSHLNDRGFWEVMELARRPFLATHSNARAVCPHPRNLTDAQIRALAARGCLIGLNFYQHFLREGGQAGPEDLLRHVAHFLDLGAGDCLALGSDFDGAEVPDFLRGPARELALCGLLRGHGLSRAETEGILYRNALRFFRKNLASVQEARP